MATRTLLFDLDGTLLPMETSYFMENYKTALSAWMRDILPAEKFVNALLQATRSMVRDTRGDLTNAQVFQAVFCRESNLDWAQVEPLFITFYQEAFPKLQRFTSPTPLAREALDFAQDKGFELVIATNPVFPRLAIQTRLQWAGVAHLPFRLVTSYEEMHYCKPQLNYYQEILDKVSRKPGECLMLGNDTGEDLVAADLGIPAGLVEDHLIERQEARHRRPCWRGRLGDVKGFLAGLQVASA